MNKRALFFVEVLLLLVFGLIVVIAKQLPPRELSTPAADPAKYGIDAVKYWWTDKPTVSKLPVTPVKVTVVGVNEVPPPSNDIGWVEERTFDLAIERPNKALTLDTVLISYSDVTDKTREPGSVCDSARCLIELDAKEKGKPQTVIVKIFFADHTYASARVTIPYGGYLADPTIISPTAAPQPGDQLRLTFKDVGADTYDVSVGTCRPYQPHSGNPCVRSALYSLTRAADGNLIGQKAYSDDTTQVPTVTIKNKIVTVTSSFSFNYSQDENQAAYSIKASRSGELPGGIKTYLETTADAEFYR